MDRSPDNLFDGNPEHHLTMNGNSEIIADMESNHQDDVAENTGLVLDRKMVNVIDGDLSIVAFNTGSDSLQCTVADISCEKLSRIEPPLVSHCVVFQNLKSTFSNPPMHEAINVASDTDIYKSRYTMDTEKSRFPAQNNVHNMSNIHDIDPMQSVVNKNSNSIEPEDSYFGSESSMFKLSDSGNNITDVKSDNLKLVDIEHAASEVSMNENSLETLFAVDNHVQDGFDLTGSCVPVHPVVLKKSKKVQRNVAAKAEGVPQGKVTMLLDLSSIDELKKLWEKSSKSSKKLSGSPMKPKQKFNANKSVLSKAQNRERILKVSVKNRPNMTTIIKPCSVKLINVEGLVSQIKDLVVDLTVPKRIQFHKQMKDDITNKANKMTNICEKSQGVNKIINKSSSDHVSESLGNGFETKAQPFMPPASTILSMEDIQQDRVNQTEDDEFPDDFYIYGDSDDDFSDADDCDYDVDFKPASTKSKKIKKTKMGKAKILQYIKKRDIPKTEPKVKVAEETICSTGTIESPPHLKTLCCNICDFKAVDKIQVTKHHSDCHGSTEMFYCRFCEKRCRTQDGIVQHEAKAHTNEKPFKCDHDGCSYESNDKRDLFVHKNKHAAEKSYCCDICDFKTRYPKNLRMHRMYTHSDERRFKCSVCSFMTKRHIDLKQHMYRHTDDKPIECSHCGFRVKTNWELQSHMLKHTDEKPFKCPHPGCMQGTKTKADLKKHMVKHQEECPFVCALCGGTYKTQSRLNKHHTYVHNATRNFDCDNCGMKFKTKQSLRKHLLLHSGYKPYSCEVCGHKFANRNNMGKHMVTHDVTVRPYRCPLCPYAAKEQGHLLAHIGTFHGKTYAYFCELCKKPFQRYSRLQTHYERMHKRDIDKLVNGPPLDLASLKMEMKLNLEEAEHEEQNQSTGNNVGCSQEVNIKVETVDEYYEDDTSNKNKRGDTMDVKMNEEAREDEIVKSSNNDQQCNKMLNFAVVPDNSENQDAKSKGDELQNKIIDDHHAIELEQMENVKINSNNINEFMEIEVKEKFANVNCFNFAETVMIDKNAIATVAMYNDFRLPLATKGFQFNYEKSGKKPNTWFMDWKLMSEKEAEKQKKYLRRIGKMQPLPKGKHKKQDKTLTGFVRRRTRKLEENIRKAKFIKDNWLATKRTCDRKSRFKGNYMEFETLQGEELTVSQVQERIPRVGYPTKYTNKNVKSLLKDNKDNKNTRRNRRNSKKQATQLPSEKVRKVKKTNRNIQFRKPAFLQNDIKMEIDDDAADTNTNRNSFDVLGTILTDVSESKSQSIHTLEGKSPGDGQRFELLKKSGMSAKKANKKSYLKDEINDNASNKQKYNKKYVPVKQAKQRKMVSAQASSIENKTTEDIRKTKNKVVKTVKRKVSKLGKLKIKICGKLTGRSSDFLTNQKSNGTPLADQHNNATASFIPKSDPQIVLICPPNVLFETNQVLDVNGPEGSNALLVPVISNAELVKSPYFDVNTGPSFARVAINDQSENEAVLFESGSGGCHAVNANVTADRSEMDLNASGVFDGGLIHEHYSSCVQQELSVPHDTQTEFKASD